MEATAKQVEKANPATDNDVKILRDALDELKEGITGKSTSASWTTAGRWWMPIRGLG